MRVGFIGCGVRARRHMESLRAIPEAETVAFADIDRSRADECAGRFGGTPYEDYRRMLKAESLDACFICLPPFAHTDQELLCCDGGTPFLVEKPVALTVEKAREIDAAVRRSGVVTQVGYQSRFVEGLARARDILLTEGGPVGLFQAIRYGGVIGEQKMWWRRAEESGGQLIEQSTHQVDQARWFVGDVTEVFARFETELLRDMPGFNIEDVSVVVLRFANGALGNITSSCAAQPRGRRGGFVVIARNLQINGLDGLRVVRGRDVEEIDVSRGNATLEQNRHFTRCVQEGDRTRVPYEEGVKALEVTVAAARSAETGRPIRLPLP